MLGLARCSLGGLGIQVYTKCGQLGVLAALFSFSLVGFPASAPLGFGRSPATEPRPHVATDAVASVSSCAARPGSWDDHDKGCQGSCQRVELFRPCTWQLLQLLGATWPRPAARNKGHGPWNWSQPTPGKACPTLADVTDARTHFRPRRKAAPQSEALLCCHVPLR